MPFSTGVDLVNAALPVPYTLVLGPGSGGNYSVYYNVYLRNTTGATVTDTFAVCVNGVKMPETEAGVTVPSDGNWYYLSKSAEVYLPSGGMVQLVNTGVAAAECTNNQGWHSFPSVRMDITYAGD